MMCRLLLVKSDHDFEIAPHLQKFSAISRNSREYQGHGWGCAYLREGEWEIYRNIKPVWEDDLDQFGKTKLLLAHARSAFRDEGISIENNMPFRNRKNVFIFNGELRGVRIKEEGRIGAEKIFNYIERFNKQGLKEAILKGTEIIKKRTGYVRAMNFIISDGEMCYAYNYFNEDPDYFQMYMKEGKETIICSDPYPGEEWKEAREMECL